MALRLLQIKLPQGFQQHLRQQVEDLAVSFVWSQPVDDDLVLVGLVTGAETTEALLDRLQAKYGDLEEFSATVLPLEAMLPRTPTDQAGQEVQKGEAADPHQGGAQRLGRISREELWQAIQQASALTWIFVALVVLSAVVAALGLLKGNLAVIIGAMVIAPLMGPSMALALATTLGDGGLARKSLLSSGAGLVLGFTAALVMGWLLPVDPHLGQLISRTRVDLSDMVLALASGAAGALAFTSGVSTALVGVMVAVSLMPPLVAAGLFLSSGFPALAGRAALLLLANLICINLAGVVTFLLQGLTPGVWAEKSRARKATLSALVLWLAMLALLVVVILVWVPITIISPP